MSDAPHTLLWKRVSSALNARGISASGGQRELAGEARGKLGTDLVERFLSAYYFERQYGGGSSELSDDQAEDLVRQIEGLPQPAITEVAAIAVPAGVILDAATPIAAEPSARDWSVLEEAEAYGDDERHGSPLDALRQFALEARANRETRRRERAHQKAAAIDARQAQISARARSKEEAGARRAQQQAASGEQARLKAREEKQQRAARAAADAESAMQRAGELRGQGNARGAVRVLEKLVRQQPDTAFGWFTLGWYFGRDGNFRRSTRCYRIGLELDPTNKTAWNNLGHDLRGMRRHKKSARALERALALDPEYVTAWANLGTTLREKRDYRGAARAFLEVVRRRENDGAAWYWLGFSLAWCGDHQGAVEALQRASGMHPDNVVLWTELGCSLEKLGRTKEASEAYARARALGLPPPTFRLEIPLLALGAVAASSAADRLGYPLLGIIAVAAYMVMVLRLSLSRVKLFWVAFAALPLLALQFLDAPHVPPISLGILLVWTLLIAQIWKYRRRIRR